MRSPFCLIILMATVASATVPPTINYQGRVTDSFGTPIDTTVDMTFRIYENLTGGSASWWETQTNIVVTDGLFDVRLGSVNSVSHIFTGPTLYLTVQVGTGPESEPRIPIVSVPFSIQSLHADTADYAEVSGSIPSSVWEQTDGAVYLPDVTDKVGIGTTNPLERLHVSGNLRLESGNAIKFGTGDTRLRETGGDLEVVANDDLFLQPNDKVYIGQFGQAAKSVIDPVSMKVGFGTTAPAELLHLYNEASGGSAFLKIQANHPTNWHEAGIRIETPQNRWHWRMDDDLNNNINPGAISLRSQNGSIEAMTWEENGFVGIGTTNPTHKLTLNGALAVQSSGNTKFHIQYVNGGLNFSETGVADYRLNIEAGGKVGIGTGAPAERLHVVGNTQVTGNGHFGGALTAGSIAGNYAANSISKDDILDDVGIASTSFASWVPLGTSWSAYLTREITVPAKGYILAIGCVVAHLDHNIGGGSSARVTVSALPDDAQGGYWYRAYLANNVSAGDYHFTIPFQRLFSVPSQGTYTYYMLAARNNDNDAEIAEGYMTLFYIPTVYASKGGQPSTSADDKLPSAEVGSLGAIDRVGQSEDVLDRYNEESERAAGRTLSGSPADKIDQLEAKLVTLEKMVAELQARLKGSGGS